MKPLILTWPSAPILVVLAVVVMFGLQIAIDYKLLAPLSARVNQLREDIRLVRSQSGARPVSQPESKAQIDAILLRLQEASATTTRIERLHQIANQYGVLLPKANYRSELPIGLISREEMTADLAGGYPAIRQFVRALLAEDQAIAIEALEFTRPNGSGTVHAQVRIALYSRSTPP